jgi:hypothetical protein
MAKNIQSYLNLETFKSFETLAVLTCGSISARGLSASHSDIWAGNFSQPQTMQDNIIQ